MTSRFDIQPTPIEGLTLLQRIPLGDTRGYFERMFCEKELKMLLGGKRVVQINHTSTGKAGTVRGVHFQYPPHAETKFVNCMRGEVFDVAVDLRRGSPTFLQCHSEILTADNHRTLVIPEGFGHGFQTLTDDCEMLYFHTVAYEAAAEGAMNALDPRLAIPWPRPITERSSRDMAHPLLTGDFVGMVI